MIDFCFLAVSPMPDNVADFFFQAATGGAQTIYSTGPQQPHVPPGDRDDRPWAVFDGHDLFWDVLAGLRLVLLSGDVTAEPALQGKTKRKPLQHIG